MPVMRLRNILKLRRNQRGSTVVEFAIVAPVLLTMILGSLDVGYALYARSILGGAIQKAARDSGLETGAGRGCEIDYGVLQHISGLLKVNVLKTHTMESFCDLTDTQRQALFNSAENKENSILFLRRNYVSFSDVGEMEEFTDSDDDGVCDRGEPFEDLSGDDEWGERGANGQGGARATVLYSAGLHFRRIFPAYKLIGGKEFMTVEATTILRNQPYSQNQNPAALIKNCTMDDL
jgi:hypothetical protein